MEKGMICNSRQFRLITLLIALAVSIMGNELGNTAYAESGTRILDLPTDRVVLKLYLVNATGEKKSVDPPMGKIIVPPSTTTEAVLLPAALSDLSFLEKLPANAFDHLIVRTNLNFIGDYIGLLGFWESMFRRTDDSHSAAYQHLKCLRGLTQLQQLTLMRTGISDCTLQNLQGMHNLRVLDLSANDNIRGSGLGVLRTMPHLKTLNLHLTYINDNSLSNLQGLQELQELDLSHTYIYGHGLKYLGNLRNLRKINLNSDPNIRGPGLESLATIPALRELNLGCTYWGKPCSIDDSGTIYLAQLTQLKSLDLSGNKITDKGLKNLFRLKHLENLNLGGTKIGDESIGFLKKFPQLKSLHLGGTKITVAALPELGQLKRLQELWVTATEISSSELASLRKALPNCKIIGRGDEMDMTPVLPYFRKYNLPVPKIKY